ncbi:hypothetical protein BJ912DRAFT_999250 [Pholiota molesta]|nr:hypothetical protein BJ912DRAFT_999250 [Pholiota molesta]
MRIRGWRRSRAIVCGISGKLRMFGAPSVVPSVPKPYHAPHTQSPSQRHPQPPPSLRRHPCAATSTSRRHPSHAPPGATSDASQPSPSRLVLPQNQIASATKRCGGARSAMPRPAADALLPDVRGRSAVRLGLSSVPSQCLVPAAGYFVCYTRIVIAGASVTLPQATSSHRRPTDARAQLDARMAAGSLSGGKVRGRRRRWKRRISAASPTCVFMDGGGMDIKVSRFLDACW